MSLGCRFCSLKTWGKATSFFFFFCCLVFFPQDSKMSMTHGIGNGDIARSRLVEREINPKRQARVFGDIPEM